jgi:hypothetical protein
MIPAGPSPLFEAVRVRRVAVDQRDAVRELRWAEEIALPNGAIAATSSTNDWVAFVVVRATLPR